MSTADRPTEYHRRLPYGERVPADPLLGGSFFPFDGDLQVVPLAEPVLPEPPRGRTRWRALPDLCRPGARCDLG